MPMAGIADVNVRQLNCLGPGWRISLVLAATLGIPHLGAIVAWSVAPQSHTGSWLNRLDGAYLHVLGLDQRWGMFSYPSTTEENLEFRVTCIANSYTWRGDLGGFSRQVGESLFRGGGHQLGIDLARYVAHRVAVSGQRPVEIQIFRHWSAIGKPGLTEPKQWRVQGIL